MSNEYIFHLIGRAEQSGTADCIFHPKRLMLTLDAHHAVEEITFESTVNLPPLQPPDLPPLHNAAELRMKLYYAFAITRYAEYDTNVYLNPAWLLGMNDYPLLYFKIFFHSFYFKELLRQHSLNPCSRARQWCDNCVIPLDFMTKANDADEKLATLHSLNLLWLFKPPPLHLQTPPPSSLLPPSPSPPRHLRSTQVLMSLI